MFSIYTYELEAGRYFTFGEFSTYDAALNAGIMLLPHGRWMVTRDKARPKRAPRLPYAYTVRTMHNGADYSGVTFSTDCDAASRAALRHVSRIMGKTVQTRVVRLGRATSAEIAAHFERMRQAGQPAEECARLTQYWARKVA